MTEQRPRGVGRLLALQELDLSVDRLRHRRDELEAGGAIAEARGRVEQLENEVGTARMALDSVSREQTRLENEADSFTRRIETEEKRLYDGSVANPKELQSIRAEIENLRNRRSRVEDEQLGHMERREDLDARLGPLEAELAEARDRLTEIAGSSANELDEIATALEERSREREALLPEIDEDLLELYEDLRAQKKGVGAAALEDRVCMACRQQLSALEFDQVKKTAGVRRCPNCRRILVFD